MGEHGSSRSDLYFLQADKRLITNVARIVSDAEKMRQESARMLTCQLFTLFVLL